MSRSHGQGISRDSILHFRLLPFGQPPFLSVKQGSRGSNLYLCKTRFQREIKATDRQIDQLVYKLYGGKREREPSAIVLVAPT